MLHRSAVTFALLLSFAAPLAAQTPGVDELAQQAQDLAQRLAAARDADDDGQQLADVRAELNAFTKQVTAMPDLTVDHYVQASGRLLEVSPPHAARICEAGVRHFPDARFLHDNLGFARLSTASEQQPSAAQVALLQLAEGSFRRALECQPETFHAHLGLCQTLTWLDQGDAAWQQLELVLQDRNGAAAVGEEWLLQARVLLVAGKPQAALERLSPHVAAAEDPMPLRLLALRATALTGDAAATAKAAAALRDAESSPRTLVAAADALAFVGKAKEALLLLAQRANAKANDGDEREAALYAQTAAAMEAFWRAKDPTAPEFRAVLLHALDHHFVVAGDDGKQTDLTGSPVILAHMLASMPAEPIKDWGNHMLFVLCARAAPAHKSSAFEQQIADTVYVNQPLPSAADIAARLTALRTAVGDPDHAGALTGLRAAERFAAANK